MADEAAPETTTSNFTSMGGSSPTSPGDVMARLDAVERSAGAAANRAAGEREQSGAGASVSQADSGLMAAIEEAMSGAEIAANAQRDLEAEGYTLDAIEEDVEEGDDGDDELVDEEPEAESTAGAETEQPESRRFTRREAATLASELEQVKGELQAIRGSHQRVLHHLQEMSGYTPDANGRYRYENLREKVLSGSASRDEREQVAQMTQWHEFAGPIFKAAEDQVAASFSAGYRRSIESTIKQEKLEGDAAARLWKSPDPIREAVLLGRELERKASKAKPAARPATPARPQHRPAATAAHIPPRPRGEPAWMASIMDRLDKEMETSAAAANRQRDREAAELEEQRRKKVRAR